MQNNLTERSTAMIHRLLFLFFFAFIGCGDSHQGPGPTNPESIKASQDEQHKAALAEGAEK